MLALVGARPGDYHALTMRAPKYLALTALAFAGCLGTSASSSSSGSGDTGSSVVVDLSVPALEDVNATSETFGMQLHPTDFAGQTTAWYFGHST